MDWNEALRNAAEQANMAYVPSPRAGESQAERNAIARMNEDPSKTAVIYYGNRAMYVLDEDDRSFFHLFHRHSYERTTEEEVLEAIHTFVAILEKDPAILKVYWKGSYRMCVRIYVRRTGEYWKALQEQGYAVIPVATPEDAEALAEVYSECRAIAESFDPADFPAKDPMHRCISAEEKDGWAPEGSGIRQQSTSVFMSKAWTGFYPKKAVVEFTRIALDAVEAALPGARGEFFFNYSRRDPALGFHYYPPFNAEGDDVPNKGLLAHKDVGVVSILYTEEPLTVMQDGEPVQVACPPGHLLVFFGMVGAYLHGTKAALHWVDPTPEGKFTMGCFPDPPMDARASPDTYQTFGEINRLYFSGVADAAELVPQILAGEISRRELDELLAGADA